MKQGIFGRSLRRWHRLPDFLMIGSIVTLVVLTSLPRLRAFVVRSNESDARETLQRLVVLDLASANFADLLESSESLRRRLQDGVLSADGDVLRYHGFCFVIARGTEGHGWKLLAWPELVGQSGVHAYCASADGEFWAHSNARGLWSGFERTPIGVEPDVANGWRPWPAAALL